MPCYTYDHLLILADPYTLPLHNLHILQPTQDFVLDLELGRHVKLCTLLNLERLVLESRLGTFSAEINGNRRPALAVHS